MLVECSNLVSVDGGMLSLRDLHLICRLLSKMNKIKVERLVIQLDHLVPRILYVFVAAFTTTLDMDTRETMCVCVCAKEKSLLVFAPSGLDYETLGMKISV